MNVNSHSEKSALANIFNSENSIIQPLIERTRIATTRTQLIRFEEKKEQYIWAHPDEICFVKSADHYIKSLIQCSKEKKWMSRHCTIKELLDILPPDNFVRLNKFYLLNRNYFLNINETEKLLYLNDHFPIPVPHRISPYIRSLLKITYP